MKLLHEPIYTFQGEYPEVGRRVYLIRFPLCNFNCAYCDTMNAFSPDDYDVQPIAPGSCYMFTGGEPTLHVEQISHILVNDPADVIVETNGYAIRKLLEIANLCEDLRVNLFIGLSPKGSYILNIDHQEMLCHIRSRKCVKEICLKVVVPGPEESLLPQLYSMYKDENKVRIVITPEGKTPSEYKKSLEYIARKGGLPCVYAGPRPYEIGMTRVSPRKVPLPNVYINPRLHILAGFR